MDIIYSVKDAGFDAKTPEELRDKLVEFYTVDGYSAEVTIDGDYVRVHVTEQDIQAAQKEFESIAELCNKGKFQEAWDRLQAFTKRHPRHSEAYRLEAQILMQQGKIDEAIDYCIEALRCAPRNLWALMLMGNLFNKYKQDMETAESYYTKVLEYYPDNWIALNNIAAVYAERKEYDKAEALFEDVIKQEPTYENAYYGLSLMYYNQGKLEKAFEVAREGCVKGQRRPENPGVSEELRKIMMACAHALTEKHNYQDIFLGIKDIIEDKYKAEVRIEEDEKLQEYAKLQYGPARGRRWHLLKYNPKLPFRQHLMVHELTHLDMLLEDKTEGHGAKVVFSSNENETAFRAAYAQWYKKLINKFGHSKATEIVNQILQGLMLQIMNCPLDLFVEQRIFDKYPMMRPMQLLSLFRQEEDNIKAIEGASKSSFIPQPILKASKIMNIVTSMHFEHLYGIRLYQYYKPTKQELETAKSLYEEYQAYDDAEPGEEFDLITYFAEEFDMEKFISMADEADFYESSEELKEMNDLIRDAALGDASGNGKGNSFDGLDDEQKKNQDKFYEEHKDGEDPMQTMMMSMYMLGALEYFDGKSKAEIQRVAFDIAMMGTTGIRPDEKHYQVGSISGSDFSGYQLLAYYYVSWKLFNPELHKTLALPFDTAWEQALALWEAKKDSKHD